MARNSTFAAAKTNDTLVLTRLAGLFGLGLTALLEVLVVTPFDLSPQFLILPLLLAALVQIGAGLSEWRHENVLPAVVYVAFGLYSCSQISQLISPSLGHAQGVFTLLWGAFAVLVATQQGAGERFFPALLSAVAVTLTLKGIILLTAWTVLWPLLLLAGVVTLCMAILIPLRQVALLRG